MAWDRTTLPSAGTLQEEPAGGVAPRPRRESALHWLIAALAFGAALSFLPFWAPLVLAAWIVVILSPLMDRFGSTASKRKQAAAIVTTGMVVVAVGGLSVLLVSLITTAIDFVQTLLKSPSGAAALEKLVGGEGPNHVLPDKFTLAQAVELAKEYGGGAASAVQAVFGFTTTLLLDAAVFILATYALLVDGRRVYRWATERSPMKRGHFHRLANAFAETGRGLLVGVGVTAAFQAIAAGIGYVALGIPKAPLLAFLTFIAALVPSVGTILVWGPLAAALFLAGRPGAGVAMIVLGLVVGLVDNLIRPLLARWGALRLPGLVVFLSMLGGLAIFGGWGVLLGPLLTRLAVEGLDILREERMRQRTAQFAQARAAVAWSTPPPPAASANDTTSATYRTAGGLEDGPGAREAVVLPGRSARDADNDSAPRARAR